MSKGRIFKRCGCRDEAGRRIGASCPKLAQRTHGAYTCTVDVPGQDDKRRQLSKGGFRTKTEAEVWRDEILEATKKGAVKIDAQMTVGEWLTSWIERRASLPDYAQGALRPNTVAVYRLHISYLKPHLGSVRLATLNAGQVAAAYRNLVAERNERADRLDEVRALADQDLQRRGGEPRNYAPVRRFGPTSLRRVNACLSAALSDAVEEGYRTYNPCTQKPVRDVLSRRIQVNTNVWQPDELGAFLDFSQGHRLGVLFELIAHTGLRRGEALGLRWSDLSDAGTLTLQRQLLNAWADGQPVFGPPKTERSAPLPLPRSLRESLTLHRLAQDQERERWADAYEDFGLIFCQENGRPYDPAKVTKTFTKLGAEAGLPRIRLHDLRHGTASLMLAAGTPLSVVSKWLGHADERTTSTLYQHLLNDAAKNASEGAAALIPRRGTNRSVSPM